MYTGDLSQPPLCLCVCAIKPSIGIHQIFNLCKTPASMNHQQWFVVHTRAHTHSLTHTHTHTHTHSHTHSNSHTHILTLTHTHTHTNALLSHRDIAGAEAGLINILCYKLSLEPNRLSVVNDALVDRLGLRTHHYVALNNITVKSVGCGLATPP